MLPRGRGRVGSFVLRLSPLSCRWDLREGFQYDIHQFSRYALSGAWSPLIGQCQGRRLLVTAAGLGVTHLVLQLF